MLLLVLLLSVQSIALLACLWGVRDVKRFLRIHPRMDEGPALEHFKDLARANMKLALVIMPVLLLGMGLSLVLVYRDGLMGLIIVLAVNAASIGTSLYLGKLEKSSRTLTSPDSAIAQEYQRVGHSWVHRALPDF